jgi:hypothetical protein
MTTPDGWTTMVHHPDPGEWVQLATETVHTERSQAEKATAVARAAGMEAQTVRVVA